MDPMRDRLERARRARVPDDVPAALAWLWRVYALLTGLFSRDLPEVELVDETPDSPEFVVLAWIERDVPILDERGAHVRTERRREALRIERSPDAADVDLMIAAVADAYRGQLNVVRMTLFGPGVAIRLDRRARRAALSRTRRLIRRDLRADRRERRAMVTA